MGLVVSCRSGRAAVFSVHLRTERTLPGCLAGKFGRGAIGRLQGYFGPLGPCGPQPPAAKARSSYPNLRVLRRLQPERVGAGITCIYRLRIGRPAELSRPVRTGEPQPPIFVKELAGKFGRGATGSPQPPPGGGLQLRVRRSARAGPPLGCGLFAPNHRTTIGGPHLSMFYAVHSALKRPSGP